MVRHQGYSEGDVHSGTARFISLAPKAGTFPLTRSSSPIRSSARACIEKTKWEIETKVHRSSAIDSNARTAITIKRTNLEYRFDNRMIHLNAGRSVSPIGGLD